VFQRIRIWWRLRKLEKDRAFLLKNGNDPRSQELLPLVEADITRLWASQIKKRKRTQTRFRIRKGGKTQTVSIP
jgi:hypothetical protein